MLLNIQKLDALKDTVGGLSDDIKGQIERIHDVEKVQSAQCVKIKALSKEIEDKSEVDSKRIDGLEQKVNSWSIMNSAGAFIAAVLGYLGINK